MYVVASRSMTSFCIINLSYKPTRIHFQYMYCHNTIKQWYIMTVSTNFSYKFNVKWRLFLSAILHNNVYIQPMKVSHYMSLFILFVRFLRRFHTHMILIRFFYQEISSLNQYRVQLTCARAYSGRSSNRTPILTSTYICTFQTKRFLPSFSDALFLSKS